MEHRPPNAGVMTGGQHEPSVLADCGFLWVSGALPVNYYEHHIGDYDKATAHLTACEDGIYSRLLRRYYDTEAPLPLDVKAVQRLVRARSRDEKEAVETILAEFFAKSADGWRHGRCDEEIARYAEKRAKAKRSADARWSQCGTDAKAMRTHSERNANASPEHDERNAHQSPVTSHQEKKDTYGVSSPAAEDPPTVDLIGDPLPAGRPCPHEEIIAIYHETLPMLPPVRKWNAGRQQVLRARWREDPEQQTLEWWRGFFAYVAASDFLTGRAKRGNGHSSFECSLPWLIKAENFAKVLEGNYENRGEA